MARIVGENADVSRSQVSDLEFGGGDPTGHHQI